MAEDNTQESVETTGSSEIEEKKGPEESGEPKIDLDKYIERSKYEELESKLGEQGNELGGLRKFINELNPLLSKLDENPEFVEAIMTGKLTPQAAVAAMEGKLTVGEAKQVQKAAQDEVKKDMGAKEFAKADPDAIAKIVDQKVAEKLEEAKKEFKTEIADVEKIRKVEQEVSDFIDSTPDFAEYGDEVIKWVDSHPEHDIETAYLAVKGRKAIEASKKETEKKVAEESKKAAMSTDGGQGSKSGDAGADDLEKYVHVRGNPNVFG